MTPPSSVPLTVAIVAWLRMPIIKISCSKSETFAVPRDVRKLLA
jgi:hypothetical protein